MKSPLKSKPLRNPGESLSNRINDLFLDQLLPYFLSVGFLSLIALLEWVRRYTDSPPNPGIYTLMALVALVVFVWKLRRVKKDVRRLRQGLEGEKAVGQFLEQLRETGAQVFHDIPGDGFNLDHVVVHRSGLYVVETKTISKPNRGEARLRYDGESITKANLAPNNAPIIQVRAARDWLASLIRESTGRLFPIRAVVVYPGWYIEPTAEAKSSDVWVLNPKALPAFISHSAEQLKPEDVHLCSYHLGRYVRTTDES